MPNVALRTVASSDGSSIAYRDFGGGGPPLVMLPGWACTQVLWDDAIPHLGAFRVVTLDFVGFGASSATERDGSTENFAQDVRAVVEAEDLSGVTLLGHSMGGAVALEAAHLLSHRVLRVIGCDSFTYPSIYEPQDEAATEAVMAPFRSDFAGTVRSLMPAFLRPDGDAAVHALALDTMAAADPACAVPALQALLRWSVGTGLARCPVPVSTINAEDFLAPEVRERYASRIDLHTISGVGHFLMLERPEAFAAVVSKLMTRPSALPGRASAPLP